LRLAPHTLLLALLLGSCAGPLGALTAKTTVATFTVRSVRGEGADVDRVKAALERAPRGLATWGGLLEPVTLNLLPTHDDLATVVGRDYGWLRAWARYDDLMLQAPSTWTARDDDVDELVLHELTHCVLFQRSAGREDWAGRRIPLWFREGMALWTAHQGGRFPSLEESARWLGQHRELDVFGDGEALARDDFERIYGLAHHAFAFLAQRYGVERVTTLMGAMKGGAVFDDAFKQAYGFEVRAFEHDFTHWLLWRGFRGWGHPMNRRGEPTSALPR
jgi:hypothetical protein